MVHLVCLHNGVFIGNNAFELLAVAAKSATGSLEGTQNILSVALNPEILLTVTTSTQALVKTEQVCSGDDSIKITCHKLPSLLSPINL